MTTEELYTSILTSRWYIAEHTDIYLEYLENDDPKRVSQLQKILDMILNTTPLEYHYLIIIQSGASTFLTDEEVLILIERNAELATLPIKN